jgi:hypothetical protein
VEKAELEARVFHQCHEAAQDGRDQAHGEGKRPNRSPPQGNLGHDFNLSKRIESILKGLASVKAIWPTLKGHHENTKLARRQFGGGRKHEEYSIPALFRAFQISCFRD